MNINKAPYWLAFIVLLGIGTGYIAHFTNIDTIYYVGENLCWILTILLIKAFLPFVPSQRNEIIAKIICNFILWGCISEIIDEWWYDPTQIGWNDILFLAFMIPHSFIDYFIRKKHK